jgi:pimeloyl-ACP methyl ester carboxylesterase
MITPQISDRRVALPSGVSLRIVERRTAERRTVERRTVEQPAAVPFVLVHGLASSLHLWDGAAEFLAAAGHHVVSVDLRGHGRSDKPDAESDPAAAAGYSTPNVAADVALLIEELGLDRPVVAGQSWGGNVVVELAAAHPSAVRGIVCVDGGVIDLSSVFATWEECAARLAPPNLLGTPFSTFKQWITNAHPTWPATGINGALSTVEVLTDETIRPWLSRSNHMAVLRGLYEHKPKDRFPLINCPVLLVPADDGSAAAWTVDKRAAVADAASRLRDSRTEWFAPAHHDLHAEQPERLANLLGSLSDEGWFR